MDVQTCYKLRELSLPERGWRSLFLFASRSAALGGSIRKKKRVRCWEEAPRTETRFCRALGWLAQLPPKLLSCRREARFTRRRAHAFRRDPPFKSSPEEERLSLQLPTTIAPLCTVHRKNARAPSLSSTEGGAAMTSLLPRTARDLDGAPIQGTRFNVHVWIPWFPQKGRGLGEHCAKRD